MQIPHDSKQVNALELAQWIAMYLSELRPQYTPEEMMAAEIAVRQFLGRWSKLPQVDLTYVIEDGTVYLAGPELDFFVAMGIMLNGLPEIVRQAIEAYRSGTANRVQ